MLGLGGAATPAGIKAISLMDNGSGVATKNMIMLVVVNATSIQLIPATVMSLLASNGATNPSSIILPTLISTAVSTVTGIILVKALYKNELSSSGIRGRRAYIFRRKKVNVYDSFVEGGKKALKLAYVVFPFVSSVLIMIALFRESGLSEMLTAALEKPLSAVGIPPSMAELLLLRPFSGSGTLAYFETLLKIRRQQLRSEVRRRSHGQFGNDILRRRRLFSGTGVKN